jgi:DNA-binding GntR family transcriptional regulator
MKTRRKQLMSRIAENRINLQTHMEMLQELTNRGGWKAAEVMHQKIWWLLRRLQRDENELAELEHE